MELEPFDEFGDEVDLAADPTTPPPDPDKPWFWAGTEWVLVVTDTADDVPTSLDFHGDATAAGKGLDPWEQDLGEALHLSNPRVRADVLEELAKRTYSRDSRGRFGSGGGGGAGGGTNLAGGRKKSSIPGEDGGPPVPRAALAAAKNTKEVSAVTSAELENVMGRPVPVDFAGMSPAAAREHGEGLLMAAERYPHNDLGGVHTYGPGGSLATHPEDPLHESAAFTVVDQLNPRNDQMWISNPHGGEVSLRAQYASSAFIGNHAAPSPTGTAVHEMGHVVSAHTSADIDATNVIIGHARAVGATTAQDTAAHIARNISLYASSSPHEAMAESFADVLVNGSKVTALSKDVHTVIDLYYQSAHLP